jgi:hypothetical protein
MFSQAGRAVRGGDQIPASLRALRPKHVLALGESQSAFFLVSYVNAIDPVARVYDGFLVHARGSFAAPLTGMRLDRADPAPFKSVVHFRTDLRVPVLDVQSETDVMTLGSLIARQPDSEHFRLWELPGAAHADTYLINASYQDSENVDPAVLAAALTPSTQMFGQILAVPMNSGPQQHYVLNAALDHLNRWVRDGKAPPTAARMEVANPEAHAFILDEVGIVRGGIRTPWVDVPTAVLSGLGQTGAGFAPLFGTTKAFDAAKLAQLYPGGRPQYLKKFAAATDATIKSGFFLEADKQEINAVAAAMYPAAP